MSGCCSHRRHPNAGDPVRDRDVYQPDAALESITLDDGDAIRNRDADQAVAITEGSIPDTGDRITSNGVRNHQFTSGCSITIGE